MYGTGGARDYLDGIKNPAPRDDRERALAARLVKEAESEPSASGAGDAICRLVSNKGLAWLMRGEGAPPLSPLELLTNRYAGSRANLAWMRRLVPMTPLEAFAAVQADEKAKPEYVAAALTLIPALHVALDAAATELTGRLSASGSPSREDNLSDDSAGRSDMPHTE
ncbi:hypothetical protein ACIPWY_40210 [Streptomyces sp. NPDC090032]|uniref:hypothetical protein n=1 Tax=unclassified Streptomyces TaxID=2593676 RepID=UPI00371AC60B